MKIYKFNKKNLMSNIFHIIIKNKSILMLKVGSTY